VRWLRIGLYTLAGAVAILLTAVAVLVSTDLGIFKDRIEELVTNQLGRELRIDGELHAHVGTSVELYAEDVFLANPAWADDEAFVTVRTLDIAVDLWSLVSGPIDVERLEVQGVRVNIEKNGAGDASWVFAGLKTEVKAKAEPEESKPVGRLPVILNYAAIDDVQVSYKSPAMAEPLLFIADSFLSTIDGDLMQAEVTGSLNGTPIHFQKTTGPIENLLTYENVAVEITGYVGDITVRGSMWIDDLLMPSRPRLQLDVAGPNASYLTDVLSMSPVTTGPLQLSVSIEEHGEDMLASLNGVFGEFDFGVDGRFQDIQELHNIELDITAEGPDIGTIIRLFGGKYDESDSFEVRGRISRAGTEVTIDNVLVVIGASNFTVDGFFGEFPTTRGGHLSLQASGPDYGRFNRLFGMPGRLGGSFTTSLKLSPNDDGRTHIEFEANAPGIRVTLDGLLSSANDFEGTAVQIEVSGPNIATVASAAGIEGLPAEDFRIVAIVEKDSDGYLISSFEAVVDDDVFRINGHVGNDPLVGESDVEIEFFGTNLGASVLALGQPVSTLPKGSYYLTGRVHQQDDKLWLRGIQATVGDEEEYQFRLSGFLTPRKQFVDSQVEIHAHGESLASLAELVGQQNIPDLPFNVDVELRRGQANTYFENGVFKSDDVVVKFAGHVGDDLLQDDMALTVNVSVPRLKDVMSRLGIAADMVPTGDLVASGSVRQKAGKLSAQGIQATLSGATLQLSGGIGQLPSLAGTRLKFDLEGDDLSRLLPPNVSGESLVHPFAVSGRLSLSDNELQVERLRANIGHTTLSGDFVMGLDPFLDSGSYTIKADSPDIYHLLPQLKDVAVPRVAKMKYRGSGNWANNFWSFDHSRLELGEGFIEINGSLDGPPNFEETDLDVELLVSSVRNLSIIAGGELPDHPLRLKARFVGTRDVMTMEDFELTFGESDLHGHFTIRGGDIPFLDIDVTSQLFDISEYMPEPEDNPQPADPVADRKVIPDVPLPLKLLESFEADVSIDMDTMRSRLFEVRGLDLDASVLAGALSIRNLAFTGYRGGNLMMSADLIPDGVGGADFALAAEGKDLIFGLGAETAAELQQLPLAELKVELAASGETVREMAGSLDGYIRVIGGAGRVPNTSFTFLTQDFFSELAGSINPFTKSDPYTNVTCTVVLLKLEDGVIKGSPALVRQTEKLRIIANAKVDLKTEKVEADFKITPQKGLGLSISGLVNPYIKLTGTLGKPALVVDPESVLIEGGVAVATAGLSILAKSFKDRFLSGKDPCGKALAEAG